MDLFMEDEHKDECVCIKKLCASKINRHITSIITMTIYCLKNRAHEIISGSFSPSESITSPTSTSPSTSTSTSFTASATTATYTPSLPEALPISPSSPPLPTPNP
eukprot:TRINITY_DN19567_c0_g1_i1.p4 TRINITY_DN19567_c0_g1~~TRINITY_DN19567_c0_g1_i1.p4  ORF type:complete len:105 (-),score=17.85 TRINITY_DN19567_c0_g1_i1:103-417(-)